MSRLKHNDAAAALVLSERLPSSIAVFISTVCAGPISETSQISLLLASSISVGLSNRFSSSLPRSTTVPLRIRPARIPASENGENTRAVNRFHDRSPSCQFLTLLSPVRAIRLHAIIYRHLSSNRREKPSAMNYRLDFISCQTKKGG